MEEPIFYGDYSFNTGNLKQFSAFDYVMFVAILVISAGIGFYHAWKGRNKTDMKHFLLAGGKMSPWPVSLSLLASFMSAITLLGLPAEMYSFTTMYFWIAIGYFLVIAGAAHLYVPTFYNLKVTSAFEYLERRFSRGVRTAASCVSVLQMILYMAVVLYAPSLALNAVTGFTLWGSVVSVGIVCTIYTAFGGMKAVLWTDCFQVVMMIAALLAVLVKAWIVVGGWEPMWASAHRTNRVIFDDFRVDPSVRHSVWTLTFGSYFTWVSIFGVNQAQVQRALSCKTLKDAKIALWLNVPGLWLILFLGSFCGLFMAAFYEKCDPLKIGFVMNTNQLLPMFVMDILADVQGLPGLFVAGLFSAALSTISSGLNAISALILEDVIRPYFYKDLRESQARRCTQILALVFGGICLGLTFICSYLGNVLSVAMSLFGMLGGPLLGIFSLGMFFPWANKWGALAGLCTSIPLIFWIGIGAAIVKPPQVQALKSYTNCNLTSFDNATLFQLMENTTTPLPEETWDYPIYTVSYFWYGGIAVMTVIVVGMVVSLITGATDPKSLDPRIICPLADHIVPFCFLPDFMRKPLRFGIDHEGKNRKASSEVRNDVPESVQLMERRELKT